MLEKQIEQKVCDHAKTRDVLVYKFTSPNRAAVPDRLLVFPNGTILFIEFKRTGEKATIPQQREHARLRGHNVPVYVVDGVESGIMLVDYVSRRDAQLAPDTSWWM